jgi:hypothetical protein
MNEMVRHTAQSHACDIYWKNAVTKNHLKDQMIILKCILEEYVMKI